MAKFYQHMLPGDNLGKITKLKYIDDISDDELILYVFEDNTKCDENYITEVNSQDAFNGKFIMAELSGPTNKWVFNVSEVNLEQTKTAIGADGNTYEIPAAGIGLNGDHTTVTYASDGTPITSSSTVRNGKRTVGTPPQIIKNIRLEPKENYLLSLHPELLNGKISSVNTNNKVSDVLNNKVSDVLSTVKDNTIISPVNSLNIKETQQKLTSPISTNVIETVKHATININVDDILNAKEFDNVCIIFNNEKHNISVEEFINRIINKQSEIVDNKVTFDDEDILIKNMIDRSKKKVYTIGVDVEIELPPKEVYKTIKDVYPEGMAEHFVNSIANRMDNNSLKQALSIGLTSYYDNENNTSKE